ncbi:B3 domain-containing protein At3g19184 [Linum perenne]
MVESKKKLMSYEEIRKQRLEENRKRMEDLNLLKLASHLRPESNSSPAKHSKPRAPRMAVVGPARRSSRIAGQPSVSYMETMVEPLGELRARRVVRYHTRDLSNRVYASQEARDYATDRAEELQSILDKEFPSFVKPMLQSHVTGGFWLGLPVPFCRTHLPKHDEMITLIDEDGEPSETKYLARKNGLSAGWRGFAIDHKLVDGDALVFQLTTPTEFKVHVIRVNDVEGEDSEKETQEEEEEDVSEKENHEQQQEEDDESEKENQNSEKENQKEQDDSDVSGTRRSKRLRAGRK